MNAGIYIHVPFCLRKCFYCDFFSYEAKEHSAFESYTHEVVAELENLQINKIDTVYIGGGTPTALPSFLLCKILHEISQLPLAHDAEITVEANPGTIDAKYLAELNARGVNRLSIGLQTTHSDLLKTLGRIHSVQDFKENFHSARDAGFKNISVDLMFGLPSQTQTKWRETLEEIIELSPEHISAYSLTPAENTPLWEQIESGKIVLPGDTIDREMYHMARKILAEAGYEQYELSNFAKHGFESRHNINCWTMKPYIGIGKGAHSFDGKSRWENPPDEITNLSASDLLSEKIILGLRMTRGVCEHEFSDVFKDEIAKLKKDGLLNSSQGRLFLTPLGMDFANRVFMEFL